MTDHDRIKQMVMDAGLPAQVSAHPAFKQFVREHAALIAEDCARVADERVTKISAREFGKSIATVVAEEIRARYGVKGE